ncbi:MAG: transposase [Candidatus Coprovivens sp.]
MARNYAKLHEKEYDEIVLENEALLKENKRLKNIEKVVIDTSLKMNELLDSNKELLKSIQEKDQLIQKLLDEIERLKNNNNKNSSNSSKPSSTNGTKIIPNNRKKTGKKAGGQVNHIAHTLKSCDVEEMLKDKTHVKHIKRVIKKLDKKYPKYIVDLAFDIIVTENITDNIDKLNDVQYGNKIKSLCVLLATNSYMSYDKIVDLIKIITSGKINLSKGTLVNWINEFSDSIDSEIESITNNLLNNNVMHVDDSTMKVNGMNYYQLCLCNQDSVLLQASNKKNREAWSNTVVSNYIGIVMKDGTRVYDNLCIQKAQCNVHISRYLKGAYEFSNGKHKAPNKLRSFLNGINDYRNKMIKSGDKCFSKTQIDKYINRYDELIEEWENELNEESKVIYGEEIKLYKRMKGKDKDEILLFIKNFDIPFSNNIAEAAQRGIKIKQKIGKFRSVEGANNHCKIKSLILTLIKRKKSIMDHIIQIFESKSVLE